MVLDQVILCNEAIKKELGCLPTALAMARATHPSQKGDLSSELRYLFHEVTAS